MLITLFFHLFKTLSLFQNLVNLGFNEPVKSGLSTMQCNLQAEFTAAFYDVHSKFNKYFFL